MLDDAVASYRRVITLNPEIPEVYCNLGIALIDQGKLGEAIDSYRNALKLKQNYAEVYNNLGIAFRNGLA